MLCYFTLLYFSQTSSECVGDGRSPGGALVVGSHEQRVVDGLTTVMNTKQQCWRRLDQRRSLRPQPQP